MSLTASWELQKAAHAALVADTSLTNLLGGPKVYDRPPKDAVFPYVTLGDTDLEAAGAQASEDVRHRITIDVWSRSEGRRETKDLMSAVYAVLHDAPLTLTGHALIYLNFERATLSYAKDAKALQGRITFRALTEPNS